MITVPHTQANFTLHRSEMAQRWEEAQAIADGLGLASAVITPIDSRGRVVYRSQDVMAYRIYQTSSEWWEDSGRTGPGFADTRQRATEAQL